MQVFFTPLSQSLRLIIHLGEPLPEGTDFLFDFGALTCLFLFTFTLMMWTNGVGASTGMFVPALAVGAVGEWPCPCLCTALTFFLGVFSISRVPFQFCASGGAGVIILHNTGIQCRLEIVEACLSDNAHIVYCFPLAQHKSGACVNFEFIHVTRRRLCHTHMTG